MSNHYLGIDVSKQTLDVTALKSNGKKRRKRVANSKDGLRNLFKWLKRQQMASAHICMESTSVYWEFAAEELAEAGYKVSVVNPIRIKGYAMSQLRRSKTDPLDADTIADFCRTQEPEAWVPPSAQQKKLRALVRHRDSLVKTLTQQTNRLDTYSDADAIASLEKVIALLKEEIADIEKQIRDFIDQDPDLRDKKELLETIKGIGETTAIHLLAELGDIDQYHNAKAVAADAGVTSSHYQSGSSVRRRSKISRMGKSSVRSCLYYPAITAIRFNPIVQRLAQRLADRGKPKAVIRVAAMRKLLHIAYGVLKHKTPFDPAYPA